VSRLKNIAENIYQLKENNVAVLVVAVVAVKK